FFVLCLYVCLASVFQFICNELIRWIEIQGKLEFNDCLFVVHCLNEQFGFLEMELRCSKACAFESGSIAWIVRFLVERNHVLPNSPVPFFAFRRFLRAVVSILCGASG